MQVVQIEIGKLVPNPWNVNRMSKAMQGKLAAYLKREGLVEPLVVRPHQNGFEILGGYHRWRICKEELGYEAVPCIVVEGLSDKRAKVLSINLNSMKGETIPSLMSSLLNDLQQDIPLPDLEAALPYEKTEIQDFLSLMQLPAGFADDLEAEAKRQDEEAPTVLTVVLDEKQAALWDEALAAAKDEVGGARNPKARTLELLASRYLDKKQGGKRASTGTGETNGEPDKEVKARAES